MHLHCLYDPFGQRLMWISFLKVDVDSQFLKNGDLMCFHEFDEHPVRIFHITNVAGRLSHIKTIGAIHGKGMSQSPALFPSMVHTTNIKTQMDIAQISP